MTMTTEDLIADWMVEFKSRGTRGSYRRAVLQFADWLDRADLLSASRSDVRRWVAHLMSEELRDSSVRQKVSALSSFYGHLIAEGLVAQNPVANVRRPKGESESRLGLTIDQAQKFIITAEEHSSWASALVWLMAGVGLRVDEACSARIEDLNGDLLTVRVKGGHRQTKPLSEEVAAVVGPVIADRTEGEIVVDADGRPVKVWKAQSLIRELGESAGIPERVTPHILRHTAATLALEAGAPVEDVSALLGHRSIETTLRYIRNRDVMGGTRKAAARLAQALKPKGESDD